MTMQNTASWNKLYEPRLDGAWRPGRKSETLTGDKTLVEGDSTVQLLDPGGSNRDVTLPAEADCQSMFFIVVNAADGAETLTVKNDGGTAIGTADRYESLICYCDGVSWSAWQGTSPSGVTLNDVLNHLTSAQAVLMPDGPPTLEDGTAITKYSAGNATPGWQQVSGEEVVLTWDGNANPGDVSYRFLVPPDCDTDTDLVLHLLGTPSSTNDSPVFSVGYTSLGAGDDANADTEVTGSSSEFTADAAIEEQTFTIANANVAAGPSQLDVHLHPKDGELGTDEFYLYGCWIEYKRKLLSS